MGSVGITLSKQIEQLRRSIKDLRVADDRLDSPLYLYHWMRGNSMDVIKAETAIRENVKWRRENGIDELVDKDLDPEIAARIPYFFGMTGKGEIPVSYFKTGDMEVARLIADFGKDRLLTHMTQCFAKQGKSLYESDKGWKGSVDDLPPERAIGVYLILDMEGFSLRHNSSFRGKAVSTALLFIREITYIAMSYFPTGGHFAILTNATKLIEIPLAVMKPLLAKRIDLIVHGTDKEDCTVVSSVVTRDQLQQYKARAKALRDMWD